MRVRILGSAAGGGVPQWNCACDNCTAARRGEAVAKRTQDSLAVSSDGERWFLLNASPDVARQIEATPLLHPRRESEMRRGASPIAGVVLTNGDLDHCLGLLLLREWTKLSLYATPRTMADLVERNVVFRTLARDPGQLACWMTDLESETALRGPDGCDSGLDLWLFALPGKTPLHLEGIVAPHPEHNVGLVVSDRERGDRIVYAPATASVAHLAVIAEGARALFVDGTFWSDDELAGHGLGDKRAGDMAHLPVGGPNGSLAQLAGVRADFKLFTHVNNTNPMLREGSPERAEVEARGFGVAHDGWELPL